MADGEINRNGATIRIDDDGGVQVEPAPGEEVEYTGPDRGTDAIRESVSTVDADVSGTLFLPGSVSQTGQQYAISDDSAISFNASGDTIIEVLSKGTSDSGHVGLFISVFNNLITAAQFGMSNEGQTTLTGTDGPDNSLNISRDGNTLYIENRTGVNGEWEVSIRSGG